MFWLGIVSVSDASDMCVYFWAFFARTYTHQQYNQKGLECERRWGGVLL
jgi:hypothetical protein